MSNLTTTDPVPAQALADLVKRAMKGDRSTLPELRQFLDTHPEVVREAGDLMVQAVRAWTKLAAGADLLMQEAIDRELTALRDSLGHSTATPVERLLIEQVILAQLEVGFASTRDAQSASQPLTLGQRDHLERRVGRAHQRLLASVKMLTTIRKLSQRPRSPIEIATRLGASRPAVIQRANNKVLAGAGVID